VKNESHLCTKKNTLFYSEFDADSEYVILSEKNFGQKNGLIDTCPLIGYQREIKGKYFDKKKKFVS